jgi:hypothetical protein
VCVCSLTYPACNAHAPYCYLWPAWLCNVFPRYLIKGTVFERHVTEHKMCILIFSPNLAETFLILTRNERDMMRNVRRSSYTVAVINVRSYWHLNFLCRVSRNPQISNFVKTLSSGSRVAPCGHKGGQEDRQTDMTKRTVAFRNFTNAPYNSVIAKRHQYIKITCKSRTLQIRGLLSTSQLCRNL